MKQFTRRAFVFMAACIVMAFAIPIPSAMAWPWSSTTVVRQIGYVYANSGFSIVSCDDAWIKYGGVWRKGSVRIKYGTTTASHSCEATFNNVPVNTFVNVDIYATSTGYMAYDGWRTRVKTGFGTQIGRPTFDVWDLSRTSFYRY